MLLSGYMAATQESGITRQISIRKQLSINLRFSLTLSVYSVGLSNQLTLKNRKSIIRLWSLGLTFLFLFVLQVRKGLEYCCLIKVRVQLVTEIGSGHHSKTFSLYSTILKEKSLKYQASIPRALTYTRSQINYF